MPQNSSTDKLTAFSHLIDNIQTKNIESVQSMAGVSVFIRPE
ncbi:hypothetical protein [uncultured Arcticibacterium sp.]